MSHIDRGRPLQAGRNSHIRSQSLGAPSATAEFTYTAKQRARSAAPVALPSIPYSKPVDLLGVIVNNHVTMSFVPFSILSLPTHTLKSLESRYQAHYTLYGTINQRAHELFEMQREGETLFILPVQMKCKIKAVQGKGLVPPTYPPLELLSINAVVQCDRILAQCMTLTCEQASKLPVYDYSRNLQQGIFSIAINPKIYVKRRYISTDKTIGSRSIPGMIYKDHLSNYFLPLRGVQHKGKSGYEGIYALWGQQYRQANACLQEYGPENAVAVHAMCKLEPIVNDSNGRRMRPLEVLSILEPMLIPQHGQKASQLLEKLSWSETEIKRLRAYSPSTRVAQNNPAWLITHAISPRPLANLQQASAAPKVQAQAQRGSLNPMSAFRNLRVKNRSSQVHQ